MNSHTVLACVLVSLVQGLCWGVVAYVMAPIYGLSVGVSMFCVTYLVLHNNVVRDERRDRRYSDE